jgi:hypothetical protein
MYMNLYMYVSERTGEPPWKEKNLHGLVQLHMLLASWVGPPDYDREVPVELKVTY